MNDPRRYVVIGGGLAPVWPPRCGWRRRATTMGTKGFRALAVPESAST